jgi:hypothetical protein
MEGLKHSYLYGLAVDSGSINNLVLVSASKGPSRAYSTENAESLVYRKDYDDGKWKTVTNGLPEPSGTTITIIVSNPKVSGKFYAVNNRGLFISTDSGDSWKKLDAPWPGEYLPQIPWALAINDK